jgi:nucleotide-binding universal stress UspA family protein
MYNPSPVPSVPTDAHLRQQRPVICAVDDDGHAPAVLGTAAVLAAQLAVPLTVVHSPSPDVYLVGEPRRAALERGNAFVDDLARSYAIDERVVELNDPVRLVTDIAEEGATMIVIGTRRRTGLRAALLGSVSQSVVASAECPVLIVPPADLDAAAPAAPAIEEIAAPLALS